MSENFFNLSGKIDSLRINIIEILTSTAHDAIIPFFIVGATARDIILTSGYGIQTIRATEDIDFAIQVHDWDQFKSLKASLIKTGKFHPSKKPYRLKYDDTISIDIIPFGSISSDNGSISWPPDNSVVMSIIGFEDAYSQAITIILRKDPELSVKVASLHGIVLMKLISWYDNPSRRIKDAKDILVITSNYLDAGNYDRLIEKENDLTEVEDFDYILAGARMLGRDIAKLCRPDTLETLLNIFAKDDTHSNMEQLAIDMREGYSSEDFEKKFELLDCVKLGILDVKIKFQQ